MSHKTCLILFGILALAIPTASFADLDNLDIGGDIRVLGVYTDNTWDLNDREDDQNDFWRTEAHLWFAASLADNVKAKISIEADRDWESVADIEGSETGTNKTSFGDSDLNIFLEEAWIKAAYLWDTPLSLTIGRQFIEYGDGFIVGDAQPGSPVNISDIGDREQDPFDAIVASLDFDSILVDLVYAAAVEERVADEDSDLYGIHGTFTGVEGHEFNLYYWFMRTEDSWKARYTKLDGAKREDLHVIGGRAAGELFTPTLSYALEAAYQFGEVEFPGSSDADISAWAVHAGILWSPEVDYSPYLGFDYFYLSGDDDDDLEGEWRQVFSNHTYGEIAESYVASNAHIFNLTIGADNIADGDWAVALKYYYMIMDDEDGTLGAASVATAGPDGSYYYYDKANSVYVSSPYLTGKDDEIGHEVDLYVSYFFSESLTAGLAAGVFIPGDAIETASGKDADEAYFVRGEVAVKF